VPPGEWVDESMSNPDLVFHYSDDTPAWNDLEITARGTKLSATLNGVLIMSYDGNGVLDDDLHQQQQVGIKGHLALQIHTGDQLKIRYREIRIKVE
jgi:hypothetical protein